MPCFASDAVSLQVKLVATLYSDFAYEALIDEPMMQTGLAEQPKQVLIRYFSPRIAGLLLKDSQCVKTSREICRLDFMPLWGGQDPAGVTVNVTQSSVPEKVNVRLKYASSTLLLTYKLMQTNGVWRIQDISYGDGRASLLQTLEAKQ